MPADEEMPLRISLKRKRVKTRRQTGQAFFSNCWAHTSLHQPGSLVRIWWLRRVQCWIKQSRTSLLTVLQGKGDNFPACPSQHIFFLIYQDNYFTQNYKTKKNCIFFTWQGESPACMPSPLKCSHEDPEETRHTRLFTQPRIPRAIGSINSAWGLTELMLVFCGALSSVCSPVQILINVKTNTVPWGKSRLDDSHGSGEKPFGILFLCPQLSNPASSPHLLHTAMTIFLLLVHAAKQISPLGQILFQPEMLHMFPKYQQKPFSELSDWPKSMGPAPPAGINQPGAWTGKREGNQITPIKPILNFIWDLVYTAYCL